MKLAYKAHQTGRISSMFIAPPFHFKILVAAEIAFSVGLMLVASRESGAWMIWTSLGMAEAHRDAKPGPPNCPMTPTPYAAAWRTSGCGLVM